MDRATAWLSRSAEGYCAVTNEDDGLFCSVPHHPNCMPGLRRGRQFPPATAGLAAEVRLGGKSVLVFADAPLGPAHGGGAPGGEVRGLCRVTMLSLGAGALVSLAADGALPRTRAYMALRKL